MITDARPRIRQLAARVVRPRALPDIVAFLEGRTRDIEGRAMPALQLVDKDDPYRGPFTTENCPDIREILRSCVSTRTRRTVIVGPTQSFKTTILIGVEAYTIAVDHGPIGHVLPNESPLARAFSAKRFQPIVDNTPWLRALKPANADLFKTLELGFTTCTVRFAGSNSPGNLASWPYRRVIGDETDKFPQLIRSEAGTRELLQQRTGQFAHHNCIDASSPTVPWGTIWQAALVGSCERYYVPCHHCGQFFTHRFTTDGSTLVWDQAAKNTNGTWDLERVARSAHYRCPHCGNEIWENHRRDMLHAGEWRPDPIAEADARRADYELVADPDCRSFFRSCFNVLHPNRSYAAIAKKFLLAGRDRSKLQNFWNSELGEVWEEKGETADADVLYKRRECYLEENSHRDSSMDGTSRADGPWTTDRTLPEEIRVLTAAVDVQESPARCEYEIVGWGPGFESWGIHFGIVEKRGSWEATFAEVDRQLMQTWLLPVAHGGYMALQPAAICWDTGHATEEVYKWVRRCQPRRVYAVKGDSEGYGSPLVHRPQKSGVKAVILHMIGTVTAKLEIYSRLRLNEPGPGFSHFPQNPKRGYDREFFRQLTAEQAVKRRVGGRDVYKFIKPGGRRNEALDIRCYNRAALHLLDPNFDKITAKIEAATAQLELPSSPSQSTDENQNQKQNAAAANPSADQSQAEVENAGLSEVQQTLRENPERADDQLHPATPDAARAPLAGDSAAETPPPPGELIAEFDPATGKIQKPSPPPEAPAPAKPNSYELITGPDTPGIVRPSAKPRPMPRPRRGSWATRY